MLIIYIRVISRKSTSVSYHNRYHFLEGLMHYYDIPDHINYTKANRELDFGVCPEFEKKSTYVANLHRLLDFHRDSVIALSYTTNGYPTVEELMQIMREHKGRVQMVDLGAHSFALNKDNDERHEILIVGY